MAFFLVWDSPGIALGIFSRGESPLMTGVLLAPELPLEEVFFLTLLSYVALLAWRGFELVAARRAAAPRGAGVAARRGRAVTNAC